MGNTILVRVDKSFQDILETIRTEVAKDIKSKYGLEELTIHGTLASQIAAAKLSGKKFIRFKVRKQTRHKGILELL